MTRPVLHIGDQALSSWSLRAWLVLRKSGLEFEEKLIRLDRPETGQAISAVSPGGTVPVLETGEGVVWDSLAISEWAAERVPDLWPADAALRSRARSVTAQMHAGFAALRTQCPMGLNRRPAAIALNAGTRADIAAIQALWHDVSTPDGPWLFGRWSIADAFFAPVAARFHHYDIPLHAAAQDYCDALRADKDYQVWQAAARVVAA